MNRLQSLSAGQEYIVTLGGQGVVDPRTIIDEMDYEHPAYTPASVAAQRRLPGLNTAVTAFAGAYHGWGFHEDGCRSGGRGGPGARRRLVTARLYECRITHARTVPLRNVFTYRTYLWLVDLDHLPPSGPASSGPASSGRPGGWPASRPATTSATPTEAIRENLDRFLAGHGIDLGGGRVTMLAHARVLGYVFNPLTVYWCHRADGTLAAVVAEVHNTYRQRHAYLLHTDDRGRAQVQKEFYVSPFYPVDGCYRMSLPEPDARLALSVVLGRPDGHSFAASVHGRGVPATARALIGAAIRHPWSTAAVSARIRWQGMQLYLRGLRPVPRPAQLPQEGVK